MYEEENEKMKKLKKLSAILLAFVMVLAFAACGKSELNAVGTWSVKLDLSAAMKDELGSEFSDFNAPFAFTIYLDLNKDGSYKMFVDEKETEKDMNTFMEALADYFVDYLYTAMEAQGIDRAAAQTALEQQFGMSVRDYALQMLKESMDITELTDSMVQEGVYEIKDNKFYMGLDKIDKTVYDLITIKEDTLTLNAAADAAASPFFNGTIPGISYPFELTRVK